MNNKALPPLLLGLFISTSAQATNNNVNIVTPLNTEGSTSTYENLGQKSNKPFTDHKNKLLPLSTFAIFPSGQENSFLPGINGKDNIEQLTTRAFGSFGVPFSSARVSHKHTAVSPPNSGRYLSSTYPYRAIGRLTFKVGESNAHCSASLIGQSIIVTAAHCVQDFGAGNSYHSNFRFTPASYRNAAPYGRWSVVKFAVPRSWSNGTDTGEGAIRANDIAVMVIKKNAANQFIGSKTGYLSYGYNLYSFIKSNLTGNLWASSLSTFGYPGLLDNGRIMHRTDGPTYLAAAAGTVQMYQGSDSTGGSSGGPWIANFGYQSPVYRGGAGNGSEAVKNVVMGVTSSGSAGGNIPKNNLSSAFGQNDEFPGAAYGRFGGGNIGALVNAACQSKPIGQNKTYNQLGYCKLR